MILGTGVHNNKPCKDRCGIDVRHGFGRILVPVVMLLCLCVDSWGACNTQTHSDYSRYSSFSITSLSGWCPNESGVVISGSCCGSQVNGTYSSSGGCGNGYFTMSGSMTGCNCSAVGGFNYVTYTYSLTTCSTQAEADSVYCVLNPTAEGCKQEDVPQNCQHDYSVCMAVGGVWEKIGSDANGCSSTCNICNSKQQVRNLNRWNAVCCALGDAPPPQDAICTSPAVPSGRGMSMSRLLADGGEVGCGATQTADGEPIVENAELFKRFCIDGEQYEDEVDTNDVSGGGEGSSSSADVSSSESGTSWGTELEAPGGLYGVLDTIRDTIVKRLTPATEEIRDCLYSFKLCTQLDSLNVDWSAMPKDSTWFYIDTGLVKYLRPFMDASVALDSNQLKAIRKLDTNALKQLRLDSALLENDTSTRRAVNSGFEGVLKNDTVTRRAVNRLDTTVVSLDSSLRKGIREGTDNLIDSMDRYLGRVDSSIGAVGSNGTPLGDSLGSIHGAIDGVVNSLDSSIRSGYGSADTGSGNFPWISQGEGQRDSILGGGPGGTGFGGLDFGRDSAWMDSMENIGYTCDGDSCCIGGKCEYFESDSMIVDSLRRHAQRLGDSVRALNDAFYRDSVDDIFTEVKDSLKSFNPLHIFDSTLLSELGASIPNSNTCPEHCSTFQVDIPFFFGTQHVVIDWGLCMGRTAFANGNVLSFLRFIIRIIVAVTCITAVMWNATRIRR